MESIMKNTKIFSFSLALAAIFTTLFAVGCASGPRAYNLTITKPSYASIEVDLIGIMKADEPYWLAVNVDKYWSGEGDTHRKNANRLSQILTKGQPWTVSIKDPKWQEWMNHGATELLVMANLPGHFEAGQGDPRRRFLPLKDWITKNNTIEIQVQDDMIQPLTPQKTK